MIEEIWKDIEGFEGMYQVSNVGRVKSLERIDSRNHFRKELILKLTIDKDGYLRIGLFKNKIKKHYHIHRLVCKAFLDNPENKPQVNHKNGIKNDNRLENLEYMTAKENIIHRFKILKHIGNIDKNIYTFYNFKLNLIEKCTRKELYKKYNLNSGSISNLINNKDKSVESWIIRH